jgi:hypothetical protein
MIDKDRLLFRLKDIRFWIVLFFLIRMYGITLPPLEVGHNWRQTDGLMIARNFYERDANILYPTVDVAGEKSGIVGSEFPLLNYLVYLVSVIFGYEHWYGRMIVLFFSSIGVFFFYKLIRKYFGEPPAFNASIILLVSLWFSYSRKNIPDVFAVSLCLISLYCAVAYLESGRLKHLLIFFGLALLGCLAKILAATILTVLLIPVLNPEHPFRRKAVLAFFSSLILMGVSWWYFIWVPHLNTTYGLGSHFFMGMTYMEGFKSIWEGLPQVLKRFYETTLKYTGFLAFLTGIFFMIRKKEKLAMAVFLLPFLSFLILMVKTGASVIGDKYYVLTVIPSMAFVAGWGLAQLERTKLVTIALIIISIEGIADQIYDFRIRQPFKSLESLEAIMDGISERDDLIAVNNEVHNPTIMYFAHRRGWGTPNNYLQDSVFINDIKSKGCKYIVIARKHYGDVELAYPVVHDSEYFKIYSLKGSGSSLSDD